MTKFTYRIIQLTLTLLTLLVLFGSLYFQYIQHMEPCPLCLMQRLCVILLLILLGLSLIALKRARLISILQILFSSAGLFFSLRHLWLQSLPASNAPACMPGLDTLIRYFPWQTVAHTLFWGAGDCAEVNMRILKLSMPSWAALYFLMMLIFGFLMFFKSRNGIEGHNKPNS